jgi:hypothetical protein
MLILRENLMSIVRTAVKGVVLGTLVGIFLALLYISILTGLSLTRNMGVLSLIFALPTLMLTTLLDISVVGGLGPYLSAGAATGLVIGVAAAVFGRRVTLWPFVAGSVCVAALVAGIWSAGSASLQFSLIPALIYVAFVGWLAYRVRVGGFA